MVKKINGPEKTNERRNNVNVNDSSERLNEFLILFFHDTILCIQRAPDERIKEKESFKPNLNYACVVSPMVR